MRVRNLVGATRLHRLDGPVFLAAGNRADLSSISARSDHARERGRACRSRPPPSDGAEWDKEVWKTTRLEAVFLTNEFDDTLDGWDTAAYVPCLRTDDLVLKLNDQKTVGRLRAASDVDVHDWPSLREAIGRLFDRFVKRGRGRARSVCRRTLLPVGRRLGAR